MQNAECKLKNAKSKVGGCFNKPSGKTNFDFFTLHFLFCNSKLRPIYVLTTSSVWGEASLDVFITQDLKIYVKPALARRDWNKLLPL